MNNKDNETESEPLDPNKRYPNPSFGLWLWGPLVPSNDCRPCLYTLTGLQLTGGLLLWTLPGRKVPLGRKLWVTRSIKTAGVLSGSYVMLLASLELVRLLLPTDPWQQDAARARYEATKRGEKVSYWFGPKGYKSIPYKEWKRRMDEGIAKAQQVGSKVNIAKEIYSEIRQNNRQLSHKILEELKKENEENPQTRENKALIELKEEDSVNRRVDDEEPKRAGVLGFLTKYIPIPRPKSASTSSDSSQSLSSPIQWNPLDQWEKLRIQTDIAVRIVPHTRGIHEENALTLNINLDGDDRSDVNEDI